MPLISSLQLMIRVKEKDSQGAGTIFISDRLADCDGGFLVRVIEAHCPCNVNPQSIPAPYQLPSSQPASSMTKRSPFCYQFSQLGMAIARQELYRVRRHCCRWVEG